MLFRVVLAIAVLAIFVYGLVDVIRTDASRTRSISKPAWIVVMILLPVLGAILWLLLGRPTDDQPAARTYPRTNAPDDDPDFLRNLELKRRNQAEAERLRKLKDELDAKERRFKGDSAPGDNGEATP